MKLLDLITSPRALLPDVIAKGVGAMTLSYDTARCTGNWLGVHGEFGRTLNQQCIGCARRTQTDHGERQSWMTVEVLPGKCEYRIGDQT